MSSQKISPNTREKKTREQKDPLLERIERLEKFVSEQSMTIERLTTLVNRIDMMQVNMDVMLRNHTHKPSENHR